MIDVTTGRWLKENEREDQAAPEEEGLEAPGGVKRKQRVIPYVEDRRNILVTRLSRRGQPGDRGHRRDRPGTRHRGRVPARGQRAVQRGTARPGAAGAGRCSSRAPKAAPACSAAWSTTPTRCPRQPGRRCRSCTSTRTPARTSAPTNPAPAGNAASGPATTACSPTATSACTSMINRHLVRDLMLRLSRRTQ